MSNLLKKPIVVGKLPKSTVQRGAKSIYIDHEAMLLALGSKNEWVHCYSFESEDSRQRRNKGSAMRIAGKSFCSRNNEGSQFNYWQFKVITVENTVNLYIICENREGTDWQWVT